MLILNQNMNEIHNIDNIDAITIKPKGGSDSYKFMSKKIYRIEALIDYGDDSIDSTFILGQYDSYSRAQEILLQIFSCNGRYEMPEK